MMRAMQYIILAIVSLFLAAFPRPAGQGMGNAGVTILSQMTFPAGEGTSRPGHVDPGIRPVRKSDRIERVVIPGIGEQPVPHLTDRDVTAHLHPTPPSPKFLTGVFNRYRPRDPTLS
jgi:hypothetical protein